MADNRTGLYIIDDDYKIVSYNETAEAIYPGIEKGVECYKCLLGRKEPCKDCYATAKEDARTSFVDPYNRIYETVDAVKVTLEDDRTGHVIIFNSIEENNIKNVIPKSEKERHLLGVIEALSSDIKDLYEVEIASKDVHVYRMTGGARGVTESLNATPKYEQAIEAYITNNVHPDDVELMRKITRFDSILEEVTALGSFFHHYRIFRDGELHYYFLKCVGNSTEGELSSIIFAFGCEDSLRSKTAISNATYNYSSAQRKRVLVVDDNATNRAIVMAILGDKYDYYEAGNGEQAVHILKKHYHEISVVLLDIMMPVCDGYEFLKIRGADQLLMTVPVLVITGTMETAAEEECLKLGAVDFLSKPYDKAVVRARVEHIVRMAEVTNSLRSIEIDALTGMYTKQAFLHHAQNILDSDPDGKYSILITDIENFKLNCSIFGEETCDELLKTMASFIKYRLEAGGICARYGGDQFIMLTLTPEDPNKELLGAKIRLFEKMSPIPNVVIKCGIYDCVDRSIPVSQMCDRAMHALKSIKHNYDVDFAVYEGEISQRYIMAQRFEARFRGALENREFKVWYQPKYSPYTEKVVGAEALVRWTDEDGKIIPPGAFLSVFEENGLIRQLDEYVFDEVCRQQKKWRENGFKLIPVSVNLSRNSMHQSDIVGRYKAIADSYGIESEFVPIEITESAALGNYEIKPLADAFYDASFRIHMDDFGSEHSSLNSLNLLRFDAVKLDKSLVDFIGNEKGDLVLKYNMALSKELGLRLVAEGVEEEAQLEFLKENGCDAIQGYYYSKPLPVEEFEEHIKGKIDTTAYLEKCKRKYGLSSIEE